MHNMVHFKANVFILKVHTHMDVYTSHAKVNEEWQKDLGDNGVLYHQSLRQKV